MRRLIFGFTAAAISILLLAASGAIFGHSPLSLLTMLVSGSVQ